MPSKKKRDDTKFGPNNIPQEKLDEVLSLLKDGQKKQSSLLLEELAIQFRLYSYEVHHFAQHFMEKAGLIEHKPVLRGKAKFASLPA